MEIKKIAIIHSRQYTEDEIVEDLKTECYVYGFSFCDCSEPNRDILSEADEVWLFGDVTATKAFYMATELGADFWNMG